MIKLNTILTTAIILIAATLNAQSPWAKGKNKGYAQIGFSKISYNKVNYNGLTITPNSDLNDVTLQAYGEYGLTSKLDVIAVLPYKSLSNTNNTTNVKESVSGIGNISLGLKYLLSDKKWKFGAGLQFNTAASTAQPLKGLRTGFEGATILPFVTLGTSHKKLYFYTNLGYGIMGNNYSDYLKLSAEVGYNVAKNTHVMLFSELRNPLAKESFYTTDNIKYRNTASYLDRQKYLAVGVKANYEFVPNKFGVNLSFIGAAVVENTPGAPSLNFGVYSKF